jgi:hypothetical protein
LQKVFKTTFNRTGNGQEVSTVRELSDKTAKNARGFENKTQIEPGDIHARVTAVILKDKWDVNILTNMHRPPTVGSFCNKRGTALEPVIVTDYSQHMGYTDKGEKMTNGYSVSDGCNNAEYLHHPVVTNHPQKTVWLVWLLFVWFVGNECNRTPNPNASQMTHLKAQHT